MSSWKAKVFFLVAAVLLVPALASCVGGEAKEVRFGCALSLSGTLEETGQLYREGYELWSEDIGEV